MCPFVIVCHWSFRFRSIVVVFRYLSPLLWGEFSSILLLFFVFWPGKPKPLLVVCVFICKFSIALWSGILFFWFFFCFCWKSGPFLQQIFFSLPENGKDEEKKSFLCALSSFARIYSSFSNAPWCNFTTLPTIFFLTDWRTLSESFTVKVKVNFKTHFDLH